MEKTQFTSGEKWDAQNYPGEGLYENEDENRDRDVVVVAGDATWMLPLAAKKFFEPEGNEKPAGISEDTHLKTIALLTGRTL
jgi:hypothetical protein